MTPTSILYIRVLTSIQLQSEHEIAFLGSDRDRITRGVHFHDEAMRLWTLERDNPTLANLQALCILTFEYGRHLTHLSTLKS